MKCLKIFTFDDEDDVIDTFASLHHSVALQQISEDYTTDDWRKFYESLHMLFEMEHQMHQVYQEKKKQPV